MIDDRIFLGFPINFKNICKVYPPTVNDVSGNEDFYIYQSLFTMTQEELEDAYLKDSTGGELPQVPTPFEYLMLNYYNDEQMRKYICDGFMLFLHEPVTIVPELEMLLVGVDEEHLDPDKDLDDPRLIKKEDFFDFQNTIRKTLGEDPIEPPKPEDEDLDPRIKRYKAKIRESEKILKRKKAKNGPKFGTLLAAICCMGIGLTPLNIGEMSYACVHWLIGMEQQKESYDIDIRSLLAGADSKKVRPKYWIKNLDSD